MTQVASGESLQSQDVHSTSPEADPVFGVNATFHYAGDRARLDAKYMATVFATHWESSDTYRRRFVPEWLEGFQQYYGDIEDRGKGTWQNNINVPKPKVAVDTATGKIVDALFQNEDFFDVLPFKRDQDVKVAMAKAAVKWQLWKADGRQAIKTAVKDALICGNGFLKVYFDTSIESTLETVTKPESYADPFARSKGPKYASKKVKKSVSKLRLEPLMPNDLWLDSSGRGDFVIQRVKRKLSDVWALAHDQKDDQGNVVVPRVYDPDLVDKLRAGLGDQRSNTEAAVIRRDTPHLGDDLSIDVYEFWGNIRDPKNGVLLYENVLMTVAEKQFVIRMPQENPYRHGKLPFIMFAPEESPHQVYGTGLLFASLKIHRSLNRQWNVILDKSLLQVPTVEVDPLAARNPEELMGDKLHFYPGKTWARKSGDRPIFFPVEGFPPITGEDLALIDRLTNLYDQGTQINEFASSGAPQSNNRKTKEEVETRTQAAQSVFNSAALHIEQHALSPLLKMIYYLTIQFVSDYDDETLLQLFTDAPEAEDFAMAVKGMEDEERWQTMYLDAEFRVTGISLSITRQDRLQRMSGFLKFIGALPQLMGLVNLRELLRDASELFDMKRDLILPNQDALTQAMEMQQIQMFTNPASALQGASSAGAPGQSAVANNPNNQAEAAQAQFKNAPQSETGGPQ
jgi:hypothetical protein